MSSRWRIDTLVDATRITLGTLVTLSRITLAAPGERIALVTRVEVTSSGPGTTPPVNTVAPVISGTPRMGQTLTCDGGTWTGDPTPTLSYQWQIDGVDVGGATSSTWVITAAGLYGAITCLVTATNSDPGSPVSASSNAITSPLAAIWAIDPDAAIWVKSAGISVGTGAPIPSWATADGRWSWTQASTSLQPTRSSGGGAIFDGIDDWLADDTLAARCNGAHTMVLGWLQGSEGATPARTLWCVASDNAGGSTYQVSLNYSRPDSPNATRMRAAWADNTGTLVTISLASLGSKGAGPYLLAQVSGAQGSGARVESLDTPIVEVGSLTRPAGSATYEWLTLGARRLGAGPTVSQPWLGTLDTAVLVSLALSDTQLATIRDAIAAEYAL